MVCWVWATDPHVADQSPVSRTDNWCETVLGKIQQVLDIAEQRNALGVIWGGDIFHIKQPDRNSHRVVNRLASILKKCRVQSYSNIGNHDVKFSDYEFLGESALESLFVSGAMVRLYDEHEVFFNDEKYKFVGIPYHGRRYDLDRFRALTRGNSEKLICCAHLLASGTTSNMFDKEDVIKYDDLPKLGPEVDIWMFGHWHKNQGVTTLSNGAKVVNIGSLSRGALSIDNVDRIPSCAVLNLVENSGFEVEVVPLNVKPAEEVFDIEKRIETERRDLKMTEFVDRIKSSLGKDKERLSFTDTISNMKDLPEAVQERALHYMQLAETST